MLIHIIPLVGALFGEQNYGSVNKNPGVILLRGTYY